MFVRTYTCRYRYGAWRVIMASGLVRAALSSILTDNTFTGISERSQTALSQVESVMEISSSEAYLNNFDEFAAELLSALENTFSKGCSCAHSTSLTREKLWMNFHQARCTVLVDIWNKFTKSLGVPVDPLIQQHINQKLYEYIIKSKYATQPRTSRNSSLSPDEENVVRYASGYVPMVLMKRHEKKASKKSVSFIECLGSMAVNGEESTLLEYTTNWVSKVNRGGLFEVNDTAYLLFREIEDNIRDKLTHRLQKSSAPPEINQKEEIISSTISDENIQFYWTL